MWRNRLSPFHFHLHPSFRNTIGQGSPNFFVRGPHKLLLNSPRAGHLTKCDCFRKCFCQINKFSFVILFFLIGKMSSRAGFGPRAVVWWPLLYTKDDGEQHEDKFLAQLSIFVTPSAKHMKQAQRRHVFPSKTFEKIFCSFRSKLWNYASVQFRKFLC